MILSTLNIQSINNFTGGNYNFRIFKQWTCRFPVVRESSSAHIFGLVWSPSTPDNIALQVWWCSVNPRGCTYDYVSQTPLYSIPDHRARWKYHLFSFFHPFLVSVQPPTRVSLFLLVGSSRGASFRLEWMRCLLSLQPQ